MAEGHQPDNIPVMIPSDMSVFKNLVDRCIDERLPSIKEELHHGHMEDVIGRVRALVSRFRFPEQIRKIMARVGAEGTVEIVVAHRYQSPGEAKAPARPSML